MPDSGIFAILSLTPKCRRPLAQFAESHVELQWTLEDAKAQIAGAIKDIQERDKNKAKTPTNGAKPHEKEEKPAAATMELLPLWCKPAEESGAAAVAVGAAPEATAAKR